MTDTPTIVVSETPSALPKSTTPDDLLKMYDEEPKAAAKEIKDEAEKAIKVGKEIPKLELANKLADAVPDVRDEAEESEEDTEEKTQEKVIPEVKGFKAKLDDKEITVPEEATFKQSINGKEVEFKAKDAIQAYVKQEEFNRNMDKRLSVVDRKEKNLQAEYSGIKNKALEVVNSAISGDFFSAVRSLAKVAAGSSQLDVVAFEKMYLDQLEKFQEPYTKMTQEQREKFFAERKAKVLEDELRSRNENDSKREALNQLDSKINQLINQNGLNPDEFWTTARGLAASIAGTEDETALANALNTLTPEDVVQQVGLNRHALKIASACKAAGIQDDEAVDKILDLFLPQADLSEEDIVDVIQKSGIAKKAPRDIVENLNRKAQKNGAQFTNKASSNEKKAKGWDKEDLDFLYRKQPKNYQRLFKDR